MSKLTPWYDVARPHEDIRTGQLDESKFGANLWAVVQGNASHIYLDPVEFFRKTYMTNGIATILRRVAQALSGEGESGNRIVGLQTAFGGGKTHTLLALWHFAKHAQQLRTSNITGVLQELLSNTPAPVDASSGNYRVAVFTQHTCDPTQGRHTPEGIRTKTLWGELALQLGGADLYEHVRQNDEMQRVPMGLFTDILRAASPCLILIDELADYCANAALGIPVGDSTLADQTISFMQQLTEAVKDVPGVMLVATLPASKTEVATSEKGQQVLAALEKRFERLGSDIKPVADEEIYDVVRSRLFEQITPFGQEHIPHDVAEAFYDMYCTHETEVPSEATKVAVIAEIERAYPFHPELINALYHRWGSHHDFQRTRGVLRLLANVIGDLWNRRNQTTQSQPLIQPCHINWSLDAWNNNLTSLWGVGYQSVVPADIVGTKSNAGQFDSERGGDYQREAIAEGIAAAILLGSFGGQVERSGFSSKDLKYLCAHPDLNWSYTDGVLVELENRCFYMRTTTAGNLGKRYWFSTKPTVNKLLVTYRQQFASESFDDEIVDALDTATSGGAGKDATWHILTKSEVNIAEQKNLTLIILHPSLATNGDEASLKPVYDRVETISNWCGEGQRKWRNTLLFLAPTQRGLNKLRQAYREKKTLEAIRREYGEQLDKEQMEDIRTRLAKAERTTQDTLGPAYTIVLRMQGKQVVHVSLDDARTKFFDHLSYVWQTLVEDEEWVLRKVGQVTLQESGLIPDDTQRPMQVKDAVDAFLRFTDKPLIATREAVTQGLAQACNIGNIGIAYGSDVSSFTKCLCRTQVKLDSVENGVWIIPPFTEEPQPQPTPTQPTTLGGGMPVPTPVPPSQTSETPAPVLIPGQPSLIDDPSAPGIKKYRIHGKVPIENWTDVFRAFIMPVNSIGMKQYTLSIDIEMEPQNPLSPHHSTYSAIKEAARQMNLTVEEEEE